MERAANKGEIDEAELRALEEDMTGRVSAVILSSLFNFLLSGYVLDYAGVMERNTV